MISVKGEYINLQSKSKKDYFIFTDIEVEGHAEHTGYTTNIRVCAGISACCYGIRRLLNDLQFNFKYRKGYFHVWTDYRENLRSTLDRDSVHALNTLICQLYEIYLLYPSAFKSFDLIDVKEKIDDERKRKQNNGKCEPRSRKRTRVGFYSFIEEPHN